MAEARPGTSLGINQIKSLAKNPPSNPSVEVRSLFPGQLNDYVGVLIQTAGNYAVNALASRTSLCLVVSEVNLGITASLSLSASMDLHGSSFRVYLGLCFDTSLELLRISAAKSSLTFSEIEAVLHQCDVAVSRVDMSINRVQSAVDEKGNALQRVTAKLQNSRLEARRKRAQIAAQSATISLMKARLRELKQTASQMRVAAKTSTVVAQTSETDALTVDTAISSKKVSVKTSEVSTMKVSTGFKHSEGGGFFSKN